MSIRIATVGYLNARPLTDYLDRDRFELIQGHPSEIARALCEGAVDLALVPVAAALSDGDFRIVPEVCIGAEGPVHSVLLVAETEPEQWTEVVLDSVSRTSRTLARLLLTQGPLAQRVRADLKIVEGGPLAGLERAGGTVAGLVIGDAARDVPERLSLRLDLAELWHAWHGLPFVFAVWAGRTDLDPQVVQAVREAGRVGLSRREQDHSGADLEYVTRYIRYALDDRALIGLRRYAALAHPAGLVGTHEVQLYDPPRRRRIRRDVDRVLADAADGVHLSREALVTVATDARTSDLTAAASLRRGALDAVEVRFARRIVATDVDLAGAGGFKSPGEAGSRTLTPDEVAAHVEEAAEVGATEILLAGGQHPGIGVDGWCRWIEAAHAAAPVQVRAFSMEDLRHLSAVDDLDLDALLARLKAAGLHGLAEGPILALDAEVRRGERWLSPALWLAMFDRVAEAGLDVVAGLEVGAGESPEGRVDHLMALRGIQSRVSAFRAHPLTPARDLPPIGATAEDYVRAVALGRLALDEVPSHQAVWMPGAPGLAQFALQAGADSLGPVLLGDRVSVDDETYVNPRARIGKKREDDPWRELGGDVRHALKKSGFQASLRGPEAQ